MSQQPSTSAPADAFADARELQWLWKTAAMMNMAASLVQLALAQEEFAADDLPAHLEHGGSGIAGSVFAVLVNRGIIRRAGLWQGTEFYGKERPSHRAGRKDAKVKVFHLADGFKARAFLKAKHQYKELHQPELIPA